MAHAYLKGGGYVPHQWCAKVPFDKGVAVLKARIIRRRGVNVQHSELIQKGRGQMQAYQCEMCGWWHLGHKGEK